MGGVGEGQTIRKKEKFFYAPDTKGTNIQQFSKKRSIGENFQTLTNFSNVIRVFLRQAMRYMV